VPADQQTQQKARHNCTMHHRAKTHATSLEIEC